MLLVGPEAVQGGAWGNEGCRGWMGWEEQKVTVISLVKGLPQMIGNAHQQLLARSSTQFLLDTKRDNCLIVQHLVLTYHDKYRHVNRDEPGGLASDQYS